MVIKCPAPGKTKLTKFTPSLVGKASNIRDMPGGMLKLRFDWYINMSLNEKYLAIYTSWVLVTLRDQTARVARFSCVFFIAMAGNTAGKNKQGSSM